MRRSTSCTGTSSTRARTRSSRRCGSSARGAHARALHGRQGSHGVTVALALAAVEAEREAVVADYALTESQLPPELVRRALGFLRSSHPDAVNIEALATKSPAPVMRALLARIDEEFGSAAGYLRAHGLTAGELNGLRSALVEG
ncbi:tyrosine-protein phosphatase [Microbacterium sp. NIBRBAC000506063]|uniref:tyrosine-protein phosphatase n=1 Tax=Microbacterium sp. NIBRBAC000506063 TaxID=2734618 RepID=UPI0021D47FBE|nr:tyrosine-protein phosphatase [Microbacterium sp. NIBRBAC000506063]